MLTGASKEVNEEATRHTDKERSRRIASVAHRAGKEPIEDEIHKLERYPEGKQRMDAHEEVHIEVLSDTDSATSFGRYRSRRYSGSSSRENYFHVSNVATHTL